MPIKKSLYISRPVLNTKEIVKWAKKSGFETINYPETLHLTVIFCKEKQDWHRVPFEADCVLEIEGGERSVEQFDGGATVLRLESEVLTFRWEMLVGFGIPTKFDDYKPHITITYNCPEGLDVSKIEPFKGAIILGPEEVDEANDRWEKEHKEMKLS